MSEQRTVTTFTCDWTDEHGDVCGDSRAVNADELAGRKAWDVANDDGWASYTNAFIRRDRWTTGAHLIFCPVHATVFRNNHGWGGLEAYEPPRHPWRDFFRPRATR